MNRTAIYFGLWAATCLLLTTAVVYALFFVQTTFLSLEGVGVTALIALTTGLIAAVGWALLHRKGRRAGWLGHIALAIGVVLLTHLVVASVVLIPDGIREPNSSLAGAVAGLFFTIVLHGWITIPAALLGTGLFVLWNRRRSGADAQAKAQ